MALNGNGRLLALLPLRFRGGATLSFEVFDSNTSSIRNIYLSDNAGISRSSAIPNGASLEIAWVIPQSGGGISAYTTINGEGAITGSGALGINILADLVGVGSLSALAQLVVSASATLAGSGDFTGNVVALLNTSANLAGSGDIQGAITALGNALTNITGSGTLSVTPYATGKLEADITPFTDLSPQNLAAAVWNEAYASYDTAGTFGKLLQDAGGGSSPEVIASAVWDELLSTHNISGSYGEKVKKLLTLAQFLALKD